MKRILKIKEWLREQKKLFEEIKSLNGPTGKLFYLDYKYADDKLYYKDGSGQANS